VRFVSTLTAGPSSPLAAVTALGASSSASLGFTVSEPLRAPPELSAERDGGAAGVSFVYSLGATVTYAWTASVPPTGAVQGPVQVVARLEDLAGNVARQTVSLPLPGLVVDTVAPAVPRADDGGLVLDRAPWGSAALGEVASATLRAGNGALEPGTLALVTERDLSRELGRAQTQDAGAFSLAVPVEALELFVSAVDVAGNRSAAAEVKSGQLLACISTVTGNPSRYDSREVLAGGLLQSDIVSRDSTWGLLQPGGAPILTQGGFTWRRRDGAAPPGALFTPAVWDEAAGQGLALGGARAGVPVTGIASLWSGHGWRAVSSNDPEGDGDPVATVGSGAARAMAHDPLRRETLLVVDATGGLETWAWNGSSWARRSKTASGPACADCQLVWAGALGRVVLLDHTGRVTLYGWNAGSSRWDSLDGGALAPTERPGASAVEDGLSGGLLLLGGATAAGPSRELWSWTPQGWTRPAVDGGPGAAFGRAAAWDETSARAVFAGGFAAETDGGWRALDEVWEWDGTRFIAAARTDAGVSLALGAASLLFDPARGQRVLLGGASHPLALPQDATWVWRDGVGWAQASRPGGPLPRAGHAATYEPLSSATYLFGGRTGDSFVNGYRDLWKFDGAGWTLIDALLPGPVGPDARFRASLVARGNGELVLHGGVGTDLSCLADTWALLGGKWAALPSGTARCGHVAWWDVVKDGLAVSAGAPAVSAAAGNAETPNAFVTGSAELAADGGWVQVNFGALNGYGAAFAVDGTTGIAHGGVRSSGIVGETWTFNGTAWTPYTLGTAGPVVANASLALDTRSGAALLFGGNLPAESAELWRFQAGWSRRPVADPEGDGSPAARSRASFTWDSARDVAVLFGGLASGAMLGDTWDLSTRDRPGHVFRTPLSALGALPARIIGLEVSGVAGGNGDSASGIEVLVWAAGAWRALAPTLDPNGAPHAAQVNSLGAFRMRLESEPWLARIQSRTELAVAIATRKGNGIMPPALAVDQVELRLEYELTK
jgi:hypothetical protein